MVWTQVGVGGGEEAAVGQLPVLSAALAVVQTPNPTPYTPTPATAKAASWPHLCALPWHPLDSQAWTR